MVHRLTLLFLLVPLLAIQSQDKNLFSDDSPKDIKSTIDSLIQISDGKLTDEIFNLINSDENQVVEFRKALKEIEEKITKRIGPKERAEETLLSMQKNLISYLPDFYQDVHIRLKKLLTAWIYGYEKDYTVEPGDNLSKIAYKADSSFTWISIYELNKKKIKNPDLIFPQQTLKIPYYKEEQKIIEEKPQQSDSVNILTNITKKNKTNDIEIEGLIVDQTLSKSGHDFYELFYTNFEAPQSSKEYTITISERPFPARQSSLVSILINETEVYSNFIQPRFEIIEELAREGVYITLSYLENIDEIQKELQGEDLQGTGIY